MVNDIADVDLLGHRLAGHDLADASRRGPTRSYAVFGEMYYDITDKLTATLGYRAVLRRRRT